MNVVHFSEIIGSIAMNLSTESQVESPNVLGSQNLNEANKRIYIAPCLNLLDLKNTELGAPNNQSDATTSTTS